MIIRREIQAVTDRIVERSKPGREHYLAVIDEFASKGPHRAALSCSNLAHGFAACDAGDKALLAGDITPNLGIITAYNDMLSAHQPYKDFPDLIKEAAHQTSASYVRRGNAGPAWHGNVAIFARCNRHGRRYRAFA